MSDHYHYGYADQHHDHRGYADERHDHSLDYAEKHHRHYDDESTAQGLREDLSRAEARIYDLERDLGAALSRISALENTNTVLVMALRKLAAGHEAIRLAGAADDYRLAIAEDLAEAFTVLAKTLADEPEPEPEEYDPGPEVDDEGGMSEYRYVWPGEDWS